LCTLCINRMFAEVIAFTECSDVTDAKLINCEFTELAEHRATLRQLDESQEAGSI